MAFTTLALYPIFGINVLRAQRGQRWAELVDRVSKLPASDPQVMAFSLTTRRIRRAAHLETSCRDPFCAVCAAQVVANFDGSERDLLDMYHKNLDEIRLTMRTMRLREAVPQIAASVAVA